MLSHTVHIRKFLIVRFSSIGDIILTTPVVRCLKKQLPDCEIHYLTKSKYSQLLMHNPYIDKCITIENDIDEVITTLKNENYELIIDLHRNLRTFRLKRKLKIPSVTFQKLNIHKWLKVRLKINILPKIHIVQRLIKSLNKLNINYDGAGLDLFAGTTALPEFVKSFTNTFNEYYVFSIGGTYFTKRCTKEKIVEICNAIPLPLILIGGEEDRKNGEIISEKLDKSCLSACGKTDILQSAQIIQNAKFTISNDTGMMHIAASMKKPVISIWGNTIPEFGMTPLLPDHFQPQPLIVEVKNLKCRPCSKLGYHKCPKGHFKCMTNIEKQNILRYLKANLLAEI